MKLRLPSLLANALIATLASFTVSAEVIGNGVVYDVGKTAYSSDDIENKQLDANFCWAAGAANTLQYWQDTYGAAVADNWSNTPNSIATTDVYSNPTGTKYLNIYQYAFSKAKVVESKGEFSTGYPNDFMEWYAKGTKISELNPHSGYYTQLFNERSASTQYDMEVHYPGGPEGIYGVFIWTNNDPEPDMHAKNEGQNSLQAEWKNISDFIKESFQIQGQAVTLCINQGHIVNCWGYEANEDGLVTSLILTNMDDSTFGAFRVNVGIGMSTTEVIDNRETYGVIDYFSYGERLILQTDDENCLNLHTYGGDPLKAWLSSAYRVATPEDDTVTINGKSVNLAELRTLQAPNATIEPGLTLKENTRLTQNTTVNGDGITVGNGQTAVLLVSANDEKLTLDGRITPGGEKAQTNGMHVSDGGMVSLRNLDISGYAQDGIVNDAKTYLHDGNTSISGNDGNGIKNTAETSYVELMDNASVTVSNNGADGIRNEKGTVSIRGNEQVQFSGNGGSDIYNSATGIVNIADNRAVTFIGDSKKAAKENVSIVNEGELYLAAGAEQRITFDNSSLKTTGKTYIGKDKSNRSEDAAGAVQFTDKAGSSVSIQVNSAGNSTYATLERLSVSANTIAGAGDESGVVSNALITSLGGLTVSNLKLDTTDTINSLGAAYTKLDNVVLTLTDTDRDENMFDLTDVLTGNLTLTKLTFDLSQTSLGEADLKNLRFDLSKAYAEQQQIMNIDIVLQGKTYDFVHADSLVYFAPNPLPEPTTCTLSLLALCALAARRHRRK